MCKTIFYTLLAIPLVLIALHTLIRIIRRIYKFPMPQFAANIIDNPFRRKLQPPQDTAIRHGIIPGMEVLEVGPGNGTYTIAAAHRLGKSGKLITIDIEPRMIARVKKKIREEGITNVEAKVANVYDLPLPNNSQDLIYMIAVIGEIPSPERALSEFKRVLKPNGTLVFSELFMDPDYSLAKTLIRLGENSGFKLHKRIGNFFYYTLIFKISKQ